MHISVTKWCIVEYGAEALWVLVGLQKHEFDVKLVLF